MVVSVAALRSQIEMALAGRVPAPFTHRPVQAETVPFNIPALDQLAGGMPLGGLTEISGPASSGHATLLLSALASRTTQAHACALVDGRDTFDPHSAAAAGVHLERLLWVRCHNIDQCLRATDLLLQASGFGLIALDLSLLSPKTVHYVPLNVWFRFRRSVENTSTIFLLLDQESNAGTCASLVLRLLTRLPWWSETQQRPGLQNACACLLNGSQVHVELVRSRLKSKAHQISGFTCMNDASRAVSFRSKSRWSDFREIAISNTRWDFVHF